MGGWTHLGLRQGARSIDTFYSDKHHIKSWAERAMFVYAQYIGHIPRHPQSWPGIQQNEWQAQYARTAYALRGFAEGRAHTTIKPEEILQAHIEHWKDNMGIASGDRRQLAHGAQLWTQLAHSFAGDTDG